ncbi:MAG: hypothetical protein ACJ8GW_00625 [Massilia sp.]
MVSASFARILAAGRHQFNQRMVEARRRHLALDVESFTQFLQTGVDPVLEAVLALEPGKPPAALALAAYDMALELTGLALVGKGARSKYVEQGWRDLAPKLAHLVVLRPAEVLGSLSNAILYLESVAHARPAQWLDEMAALAPRLQSIAHLHGAGQIVAWRAGVAHFRKGAIDAGDTLAPALALAAFALPGGETWPTARAQMLADPWWIAGGRFEARNEVGAFTGFGGEFAAPPQVRPHPDGFLVKSGERYQLLIADACGAVLHGASAEEFEQAIDAHLEHVSLRGATLRIGARLVDLDLPEDGLSVCSNGYTAAVTSPYTHAIRLFPVA